MFESGEESSRKQAELKVEAYCVPCTCAFLLLLCTVELDQGVVEVALAPMASLCFSFLGELRLANLRELGLIAVAGLQLQREMEGNFSWGSHARANQGLRIGKG